MVKANVMLMVRCQLNAWMEEIKALPGEVKKGIAGLPNLFAALIAGLFKILSVLLGLLLCIWILFFIFTAEHTPLWHIWHFLYH